jgi:hypothetical protein
MSAGDDDALVAEVLAAPERASIPGKLKALLALAAAFQQGGRAVREKTSCVPGVRRPTSRSRPC